MAGKKWCQYCRINITYTRKDIQDHEATRLHLQNKQKLIQFERNKVRKERSQSKKSQQQVMLGTANIPKAKKGSQLQKQIQSYRQSVFQQGKNAIHRMIAQRTQGMLGAPIEYPAKQDLVLADNYQNSSQGQEQGKNYEMWKIDICETTGDACFINRITKSILYYPPKGYVLSIQQKQQWQYLKQLCKQKIQINPNASVNISQWEEMAEEQNYFEMNRVADSSSEQYIDNKKKIGQNLNNLDYSKYLKPKAEDEQHQNNTKQQTTQTPKTFLEQLQSRLINNQISTNQVFQKFIAYEMKNSRTIKQKNQNLKRLIESGIQIRTRPTDDLIEKININMKLQQIPKVTFKARKKAQQNVQAIQEKDVY